jgi:alpha-glucosidase
MIPVASDSVATWWRHGVVYQIYPRSFADANGDGTGDLEGIRSRLPYLRQLGVDAIWICPWYPSPLNDGGYDVVDYRDIDPRFGTLAHAEALIADAHSMDIRVVIDIVPNHTSSEHPWFQAALAAAPGSPDRDRYIFREGKGPNGDLPPNNWRAVFGGPGWRQVADGQWYLHLFDSTQPDLNWTNEEVRAEFDEIFRYWLDRGVDGFRIDVAHSLMKDQTFPDLEFSDDILSSEPAAARHPHWDRDELHDIVRRWRRILDECGRDVMMVAEAWVSPERLPLYLRPDEYHQSFNFEFLVTAWERDSAQAAIDHALGAAAAVGATSTWTLSNHDVMRHATRHGLPIGTNWRTWPLTGPVEALDSEAGLRRARAATLLLLGLPGSAYIYQGEELGLPEVWDLPPEVLDDPVWENSGRQQKGRDGCRVPIPWTVDGPSFGFGDSFAWLPQPAAFGELSVQAQQGRPGSTLELYRAALAARRLYMRSDETLEWIDLGRHVLAFRRGSGAVSITNFGSSSVDLPPGEVIVATTDVSKGLPTDATAWVLPNEKEP